jgi:hypothetical protein
MPIADTLINNASGNRIISFLDGNAGYNLKGKCALGPFLSILVIECQHNCFLC